jgi:hypothetical protein
MPSTFCCYGKNAIAMAFYGILRHSTVLYGILRHPTAFYGIYGILRHPMAFYGIYGILRHFRVIYGHHSNKICLFYSCSLCHGIHNPHLSYPHEGLVRQDWSPFYQLCKNGKKCYCLSFCGRKRQFTELDRCPPCSIKTSILTRAPVPSEGAVTGTGRNYGPGC